MANLRTRDFSCICHKFSCSVNRRFLYRRFSFGRRCLTPPVFLSRGVNKIAADSPTGAKSMKYQVGQCSAECKREENAHEDNDQK